MEDQIKLKAIALMAKKAFIQLNGATIIKYFGYEEVIEIRGLISQIQELAMGNKEFIENNKEQIRKTISEVCISLEQRNKDNSVFFNKS